MAGDTRTLKVVIVGNAKSAEAALGKLQTEGEKTNATFAKVGGIFKKSFEVGGIALAVAGAASVDFAAKFDAAMERVHTQAGASQAEVDRLKKSVLALAGKTAQTPEELANGLYHIESAGFRGARALAMLEAAAKGATVGNANLEDVTQAMIASMASGIKGVHGASDAMAIMNQTVGIGDMKMEQLAKAFATGILPSARSAGLSMKDVSAALATVTDNATPADETATRLRMTFALMSAPTSKAVKALKSIGLTSTSLAEDMRKPNGLLVAVMDLKKHMEESGKSAVEQNAAIEHAFGGGKTSGSILTLIEESDRLKSKYEELGNSAQRAKKFQDAWAKTQQQFSTQVKQLKANAEALGVTIGNVLIPPLSKAAGFLASGLNKAITGVGPAMARLKEAFKGGSGSELGKTFSTIEGFGKKLIPVIESLGDKAKQVLMPALKGLANAFNKDLLPGIRAILPVLEPVAAFILKIIGGAVIGAIHGVIKVLEGAFKIIGGLFSLIADLVTGKWGKLWDDVKKIATGVWDFLVGALETWWNVGILNVFRRGFTMLVEDVIKGGWKKVVGLFTDALGMLERGLLKVVEYLTAPFRAGFRAVEDFIKTGWEFITGKMSGGVGTVGRIIGRVIEVLTYPWRAAFTIVKDVITGNWSAIPKYVGKVVDDVLNVVKQLPGKVLGFFKDAGTWLLQAGKDVLSGFIHGIESMAGDLTKAIANTITSHLPGFVKKALGINSPSKVFAAIGEGIPEGMALGITRAQDHVSKAAASLLGTLPGAVSVPGVSFGGVTGPASIDAALAASSPGSVDLSRSTLATAANSAGNGGVTVVVNIPVKGSVVAERDLVAKVTDGVRTAMRQRGVTPTI